MTVSTTFWACCFRIRTIPYKALRYVLYEDMLLFNLFFDLEILIIFIRTSKFQNIQYIDYTAQVFVITLRGLHPIVCLFSLIFLDLMLKNGTIIGYFSCWKNWRYLVLILNILIEIMSRITIIAYQIIKPEEFYKVTQATTPFLVFDFCQFAFRFSVFIYLQFVFKSLEKFLIRLNRSDEFDGENFDNVSQTKSEKDREEKRQKLQNKGKQEKKKEKTDVEKANDLIDDRMAKFFDFSQLKKPGTEKQVYICPEIREGDLPANNSFL